MAEIWKTIDGWSNYEVSDFGRVRRGGRLLGGHTSHGYCRVYLCDGGRRRCTRFAHSLVAETFLGPCPPGHQVNHINGNKADNRVGNLEYVTPAENTRHAIKRLGKTRHGEKGSKAILTEAQVREIYRRVVARESQAVLAAEFGVQRVTINQIIKGRNWRHLNLPPLPVQPKRTALSMADLATMRKMWAEGWTQTDIGARLGISQTHVSKTLACKSVKHPPRH
jgi:DNA-binding XRE family transcriptional regulator